MMDGEIYRQAGPAFVSLEELVSHLSDGDNLAIPTALGDFSAVAMAATRAIIRKGVRGLHITCVPTSSLQADMLIGAGCVASIEAGAVLLYEYGPARRFTEAVRTGRVLMKEATCPAIQAGLAAAEKGVPFMPLRGVLGSDVLGIRAGEWKVISNPYPPHDPIVVVPAIRPDIALVHVPLADSYGNLWIGRRGSLRLMAHAASKTLVTFEHLHPGNLFEDREKVPGAIPAHCITALSHQPRGAWPLSFGSDYPEDVQHMQMYAEASRSQETFSDYLAAHVFTSKSGS